jgi:mono/diheme cytochrome c family protein
MNFPIFHLDFIGNRMLFAVIAILHVMINHALAVGFIPVITLLEYFGYRKQKSEPENAAHWDTLAKKMMFVAFVITTSVGAMTGVGIWFSAALVNPGAIGSLIRVFYGAWFTEWIIFIFEIIFVMIYFLTWKRSNLSLQGKKKHILFGAFLSVFSWMTMTIIVAILGFMMDPGNWLSERTFISGFANPLYIPQLYFRTPLAMMMGGAFALFLTFFFIKKGSPIRDKAVSYLSLWILIWAPVCAVGALLYRTVIPEAMLRNLPTAVATRAFLQWYNSLLAVIIGTVVLSILIALWGFLKPRYLPRAVLVVPLIALFLFLGSFERIREFIRKPFVIGEYMYANGLRVEDYPLYKKDGILPHAVYINTPTVTEANKLEAGKNVFMLTCSRCHTMTGLNSVVTKFRNMAAGKPLDAQTMKNYIPGMHKAWYYMPPFPGNEAELDALVAYILDVDKNPKPVEGAQTEGVVVSPLHTEEAVMKEKSKKEN